MGAYRKFCSGQELETTEGPKVLSEALPSVVVWSGRDAIAPPQYRGLRLCPREKLNFNVEINVFCAFCKGEVGDNINFQHFMRGQHCFLLHLPVDAHVCSLPLTLSDQRFTKQKTKLKHRGTQY